MQDLQNILTQFNALDFIFIFLFVMDILRSYRYKKRRIKKIIKIFVIILVIRLIMFFIAK